MDWATSVAAACCASRKHRSACARKRCASVIPIAPAFMCHFAHKSWGPNPHVDLTFHFCKTVTHADTYGTGLPGASAPLRAAENVLEGIGEPARGRLRA